MKRGVFIFMVIILSGCYGPGRLTDVQGADGKADYQVTFLFEKDGLRIYRFIDGGTGRYFAVGNGKMLPQIQHTSNGKSSSTWSDGVEGDN